MEYYNLVVELDGTRDTQSIVDEFNVHGATITYDESDADVIYAHNVPENLIDYIEGIASFEEIELKEEVK